VDRSGSGGRRQLNIAVEKPDVFLCHNAVDKDWVRELGARLEAESIDGTPDGRRLRVFFDEWDIEKGENIVTRLGQGLASGAFVAVTMSPEFFASDWTRFEWTDVVARDPANKGGRLLPLRLRDLSLDGAQRLALPAPFNAIHHFDFRSKARFEAEFQDLLRRIRNLPLSRGRALPPRYSSGVPQEPASALSIEAAEVVSEMLLSNLAPFAMMPPSLYTALAKIGSLSELPVDEEIEAIPLMLWGGKLVTFADLEDPECRLNSVIDPYTIERQDFYKCARDQDLSNWWLALANKCLARALRKKGISQDEKGRFYFLPGPEGRDRQISIGTAQPRDVAAKKTHHATGEEFWVHYSANIRFRLIDSNPFLRILPSYAFTRDGVVALDRKQAGRFRVIWGGKQDSATVLRQVLFWLRYLSDGHEEWTLETGGAPIAISVMPATAETQVGIALDHIRIKALVEDSTGDELATVADSAEINTVDDADGEDESDVEELGEIS
jgi:hypothetical protein